MLKVGLSEEKTKFYEKLGFDSKLAGCVYFDDLVEEVRMILDLGDMSTFNEIRDFLPRIELESYHFFFEVGRFKYYEEIDKFLKSRFESRKRMKKSKNAYVDLFGNNDLMNKDKSVYRMARYLNEQRDLQNGHVKQLVKDNSSYSKI